MPDAPEDGPADAEEPTVGSSVRDEEDLHFRIRLDKKQYELGEEIPARLVLRNVGVEPIRIYDPARSIPADLEFTVRAPGGRKVTVRQHRAIEEDEVREEDIVSLKPDEEVVVVQDLRPTLRSAGEGATGEYQIRATFKGGYQGSHLTMKVWNRGGGKVAGAPAVKVKLTWPRRLAKKGITQEIGGKISELLLKVGRDGRPTQGALKALSAFGEMLPFALAENLADTTARPADRRLIGWNSFFLLKEAGEKALPAVDALPNAADLPAASLLRRLILGDAELDEKVGGPLANAELRKTVSLTYSRAPGPRMPTDHILFDGTGRARYERTGEGGSAAREGEIPSGVVDNLFKALVEDRAWLLSGVRKFGLPGEALLKLELTRSADGGREILWSAEVWENEALVHNRIVKRILDAIGAAKLALPR